MRNSLIKSTLFIIVGLSIIGFLYTLATKPTNLLHQTGYILLFALSFYFIYRFIIRSSPTKGQDKAYLRAAKQSKNRSVERTQSQSSKQQVSYFKNPIKVKKKRNPFKSLKRRNSTHLKVIEGKKNKSKRKVL